LQSRSRKADTSESEESEEEERVKIVKKKRRASSSEEETKAKKKKKKKQKESSSDSEVVCERLNSTFESPGVHIYSVFVGCASSRCLLSIEKHVLRFII
jgi:hypothetical protein